MLRFATHSFSFLHSILHSEFRREKCTLSSLRRIRRMRRDRDKGGNSYSLIVRLCPPRCRSMWIVLGSDKQMTNLYVLQGVRLKVFILGSKANTTNSPYLSCERSLNIMSSYVFVYISNLQTTCNYILIMFSVDDEYKADFEKCIN